MLCFEQGERTTRILVDPWLSDHSTGDSMGRFPRISYAASALEPIDAIFISHAHCDHLDPYTLIRLWKELVKPPVLIVPVSLSFLLPLFRKYLNNPDILLIEPHTQYFFQ
ncbi:MAG: hypothetical protein CMK59_12440, partial [Proteobacteria bacterium]|nr:hypothetical protein [Pseudomonadota bacterium]